MPEDEWGPLCDQLAADVHRVSDRLRDLSLARLQAAVPRFPSRAVASREAARLLAVAAQGIEERGGAAEPAWRTPPELTDLAAGDLVAVTGHDLLTALDGVDPAEAVWSPGARRTVRDVVTEAAATLAATRRLL